VTCAATQERRAAVAAIVLAAGCASRMGEQKLLLDLDGRSLVEHVVDAALGSRVEQTVVVLGCDAARVRARLGRRPVTVVVNTRYEDGMSTSLQVGLRAVLPRCCGALFLLGDQPFVSSALIDRLVAAFAGGTKAIVRPLLGETPGNPVLMSASLFPEVLAQRGDVGGREIVARHPADVDLVSVDDAWVGVDVDTVADYETARSRV